MKLPWISRASHDEAVAMATARADAEHENAQALRRDYTALLDKYHMLRIQGHGPTAPPEPPKPAPVVDRVMNAVNGMPWAKDGKARAAALRQITKDRKAGLTDDAIILRVQRGTRPADHDLPPTLTPE